jgi:hypothetical protein
VCMKMQCTVGALTPKPTLMASLIDTTSDTTQHATCRNGMQLRAKESAYIS